MTPSEVFEGLGKRVAERPELVQEVGAVFQFNVQGDEAESWTVNLRDAPGSVHAGDTENPDCVITVSADDLAGIMSGGVDPQTAFMMGRIKVAGNFMLATKLRSLI